METECIELFERDFKKKICQKSMRDWLYCKRPWAKTNTCSQGFNLQFCRKNLTKQEIILLQSFRPEANLIKNKYFFSMLTYMYITRHGTLTGMANHSMGFNCGHKNY